MDLLWCGPVSASNLAAARWNGPAPRVVTVNHGAGGSVGSDAFKQLGADLLASGSILTALGIRGDCVVCGFSAAHGLIEAILSSDDFSRVAAVGAFDAYYTSVAKQPKPGYLRFAEAAAAGSRRMIMTSSLVAGPTYPSGAEATGALLASIPLSSAPLVDVPPARCRRAELAGNLRWYTYDDRDVAKLSHVQHATVLAPFFVPELVSGLTERGGGGGLLGFFALLGLAAWSFDGA